MINVDIIARTYFESLRFRRLPYFSHQRDFEWFPVWSNLKDLQRRGVRARFFNALQIDHGRRSEVVMVDYRTASDLYQFHKPQVTSRHELFTEFLEKLRANTDKLILFETKDSTNIQYEFLPHVDLYLKKQLLKDSGLYEKPLHGHRAYTDFYAEQYGLEEDNFYGPFNQASDSAEEDRNIYQKHKSKISLAWNLALCRYRAWRSPLQRLSSWLKPRKLVVCEPGHERHLRLSANFRLDYDSHLIGFQRKKLLQGLEERFRDDKAVSCGIVPKKEYRKNLTSSKSVLSPFGWGEICYRDFEAFASGTALIKPAMDHIDTWPDVYLEDVSYISIPWDIEDGLDRISEVLRDEALLRDFALRGQTLYADLWSQASKEDFCRRFIEIIGD